VHAHLQGLGFERTARQMQRNLCMRNAKWTMILTLVTIIILIIILFVILYQLGVFGK
jgi:hypothetical protein